MRSNLVDQFREWEGTHNTENYGRYDAYAAGYERAKNVESERDCYHKQLMQDEDKIAGLRSQAKEWEDRHQEFLSEHSENVRLHTELEDAIAKLKIATDALAKIADMDYRGNQFKAQITALRVLADINELETPNANLGGEG